MNIFMGLNNISLFRKLIYEFIIPNVYIDVNRNLIICLDILFYDILHLHKKNRSVGEYNEKSVN